MSGTQTPDCKPILVRCCTDSSAKGHRSILFKMTGPAGAEGLSGRRCVRIQQHLALTRAGLIAGGKKLNAQLAGSLVVERQRGGVMRNHLAHAGGKSSQQLANVHIGQQQAAEFGDHRFLRLLLPGHIAGDLGKSCHRAGAVVDGREHDIGPEAGAVLAHAPALFFHALLGRGLAQQLGGLAAVACPPA